MSYAGGMVRTGNSYGLHWGRGCNLPQLLSDILRGKPEIYIPAFYGPTATRNGKMGKEPTNFLFVFDPSKLFEGN